MGLAEERWELGVAGSARVVERVHAGECFEVFRLEGGGRQLALKVPSASPSKSAVLGAKRTFGGISTVWDVACEAGRFVDCGCECLESGATLDELLGDEGRRLQVAGRSWNHEPVGPVRGVLGARGEVTGLVTPWHPGLPLQALDREERRRLWPRMLPAFWDALCVAPHGDVHGSNVIVDPDRSRFALIDPGAQVLHHRGEQGASDGASTLTFVTTIDSYPVLPPYCRSGQSLASGATLRDHWTAYVCSLMRAARSVPVANGEHVTGRQPAIGQGPFLAGRLEFAGEPHPADLLAAGLLYYLALTGVHPFGELLPGAAWLGLETVDERTTAGKPDPPCLARGVAPPSAFNPAVQPGEDALALALLDLQVPSRERLLGLVARASSTARRR